jgi:hypothetical protein
MGRLPRQQEIGWKRTIFAIRSAWSTSNRLRQLGDHLVRRRVRERKDACRPAQTPVSKLSAGRRDAQTRLSQPNHLTMPPKCPRAAQLVEYRLSVVNWRPFCQD